MRKTIMVVLALLLTFGMAGTALAASMFSDVPQSHWSYDAVNKLAKAGVIEGNGDGTFQGNRTLSRYEMAIIVGRALTKMDKADASNKELIEKLAAEYSAELKRLDDKYDSLDKRVDNVMLSGYVRAKYDSDRVGDHNVDSGNKHFYMDLEANMKVDDRWSAHFQSETNKQYTAHTWNNARNADDDSDGTFQRIWVTGTVGDVGVSAGKKWFGVGPQSVLWGHAATGAQIDIPAKGLNVSLYNFRAADPGEVQLGRLVVNGVQAADNWANSHACDIGVYGGTINTNLSSATSLSVSYLGNKKDGNGAQMSNAVSTDLITNLGSDVKFTGTFVKTNADDYNKSQEYRLDYKGADTKVPGSYGIYARYFKFEAYGDYAHDTEWGSLPSDAKGLIIGYEYIPGKNIKWTTLYGDEKINLASGADNTRKLLRTQIDYFF